MTNEQTKHNQPTVGLHTPGPLLCGNAQPGTYGHECGERADWIGTKPNGFKSGFCDYHKHHGYEAKPYTNWEAIAKAEGRA